MSPPSSDAEPENPYAVSQEELERGVRVPLDDQVVEQEIGTAHESGGTWDELQRQVRLAGGA